MNVFLVLDIFTDFLDLSGNFNHLKINDNPNMPYERTNADGSETNPIQFSSSDSAKEVKNSDNSANKSFGSIQQKSAADDLSVEDRKKFEDKLKLPLKGKICDCFTFSFHHIFIVLD